MCLVIRPMRGELDSCSSMNIPARIEMKAHRHRKRMKAKKADRIAPEPGHKIRVVVADDHPTVREALIRVLKTSLDIEVLGEAADGFGAVELVQKLQPDVVIMDVMMPGLDGIEATRLIMARCAKVRIIGLSMREDAGCAAAMRTAGAAAFLPKHGSIKKLMAAVHAFAGIPCAPAQPLARRSPGGAEE
jgi:DNA-binding NarL/FixJ family response regulator